MYKSLAQKFGKVAVLLGGKSGEREISLKSGHAVYSALCNAGVDAHMFDPSLQDLSELSTFNRAFIALHGRFGEDGTIQGALELMELPYTGSGVMASAVGMDKWRTKLLWRANGVMTPEFEVLDDATNLDSLCKKLGLPLFVKPANEGSSIGISKVKTVGEMQAAYELAVKSDPLVIAEKYIDGGEYTVAILGDLALPIVRIVPKNEYYDYDAKYISAATEYHCPSGLAADQEKLIQQEALQAFRAVGCRGWGRVDFLMDSAGRHYFLELNTSPGMTDHSLVPMAARATGMSFESLVLAILDTTLTPTERDIIEQEHEQDLNDVG